MIEIVKNMWDRKPTYIIDNDDIKILTPIIAIRVQGSITRIVAPKLKQLWAPDGTWELV